MYILVYGALSETCPGIGRYLIFYNSQRPPRNMAITDTSKAKVEIKTAH